MRHINKVFAAIMAVVMMFAMVPLALAEDETGTTPSASTGTRTITITSPAGVADDAENVYNIYKVFDASADANGHISYKPIAGKEQTLPITSADGKEKFDLDEGGNVVYYKYVKVESQEEAGEDEEPQYEWKASNDANAELSTGMIKAISDYVSGFGIAYTIKITGANKKGTQTNVEDGYYFITTTTGTVVTIDSTSPNADVKDKNEMTTVVKSAGTEYDKDSMEAIRQAGLPQDFAAEITLGKGTTNLKFIDTMTNMTFVENSLEIKIGDAAVANTNYTLEVGEGGKSFTVDFDNDYIHGLTEGTVIKLTYKGTVDSAALDVDPATNKAKVTFGEGNINHSDTDEVKVYNAKLTVSKRDGSNENAPLEGAGFVLKNSAGKYYKLTTTDGKDVVSWVDSVDDADEYTSGADGKVKAFTGLENGTYTLVENTVPAGYNRAADKTFTVADGDVTNTNTQQTMTVDNFKGTELPSTGGIGTTIFYIVGGIMVAGAVVYLLTKRRMGVQE